MRVISGTAKGKNLKSPKGKVRPLSGQVKEALFNILRGSVAQADFLDLFAGSGQVGIEALSRGARLSIFVEVDHKRVRCIRENLELCGFSDRAEVFAIDVLRALKILSKKGAKFDIIFMGAPYGSPALEKALKLLGKFNILNPDAVLIAEHHFKHKIEERIGSLLAFREERYGDTVLKFYKIA